MRSEPTETVLFSSLPSPEDEQFRARRLQVFNWGTFSHLHTVEIAHDGMLLLGGSGAGKSTLLDAVSAMIVPPSSVHFNAAADEGTRGGNDRTLVSYVRGVYGEKGSEDGPDVVKQCLRDGPTWSAIGLAFGNKKGRTITLVRLFWVTGASMAANLNRHYMVVEGEFDLGRELAKFDGDRRKLKQLLDTPHVRHHDQSFASYQEHWCRIMGIEQVGALELLHRTQSAKNLGDLNAFLREYMLRPPQTFETAKLLVEEFHNLDEAHRAVAAARQQIDRLTPARAAFASRDALLTQWSANEELVRASGAFVHHQKVGLIEQESRRLDNAIAAARAELETITTNRIGCAETITSLEGQRAQLGGNDIAELESKLGELTGQRRFASEKRDKVKAAAQALGWSLAEDSPGYVRQQAEARAIGEDALDRRNSASDRRSDLNVLRRDVSSRIKDVRQEIEALEASPSNIPAEMQRMRTRMCRELSLSPSKVVFAGELIQVRAEDATEWAPAAERLLRSFALDMLIDERDHKRVVRWVNDTHLGMRLVYHPVDAEGGRLPARGTRSDASILDKLETKDHPFRHWLQRELGERFDYQCVPAAADLLKGPMRITAQGQIRHRGGRTEKNDRHRIDDRSQWVLGFDSREKLALFKKQEGELKAQQEDADLQLSALETEQQQDYVRLRAAHDLEGTEWREIDVSAIVSRIHGITTQLEAIRTGNRALADIEGQLGSARETMKALDRRAAELEFQAKADARRLEELALELQGARYESKAIQPAQRDALRARLPEQWSPTLATVAEDVQRAVNAIHSENKRLSDQGNALASQITHAFGAFLLEWPAEAGALQPNLESAPDFFARLSRLEVDGLPEYENRFLTLLRQQSRNRLAELASHISLARREITNRLSDVNESLAPVDYNPGSYLQLKTFDLHLPDPTAFRQRLTQLLADQHGQTTGDLDVAESQFLQLRSLVTDLKSDDPEKRRWRDTVLDVRRHVEFVAEELERGSNAQLEVYSGSSGKSGGQRQKLTATCLAAALRYQLGGSDGGVSQFGTVLLDEAFSKTDSDFTATGMEVFTRLGFQMVVATPLKSVMALEEYVGGATFVKMRDRNQSNLLSIDYDEEASQLTWSDEARAAREEAEREEA